MLQSIWRFSFVVAGALSFLPALAQATPAQVILIRHAEKTLDGMELSEKGFRRADALVSFFTTNPEVLHYGKPAVIYATDPKRQDSSIRQIQTVQPLARKLGLRINHSFKKKEVEELVQDILNSSAADSKTVVVSWSHNQIPEIAAALGAANAPGEWDDNTFDRAWIITFANGPVEFKDLPQRLLQGDSTFSR